MLAALVRAVLKMPTEDTPHRVLADHLQEEKLWTWEGVFGLVRHHHRMRGVDDTGLRLLAADWLEQDETPATIRRLEPTPQEGYGQYSEPLLEPTGPKKWIEVPNPEYRGGKARAEFIRAQCAFAGKYGSVDDYRHWGMQANRLLQSHVAAFAGLGDRLWREAGLFGTWGHTIASYDCRVVFTRGWIGRIECDGGFWLERAEQNAFGEGADLVANHLISQVYLMSEITAVVMNPETIGLIGSAHGPRPTVGRACQRAKPQRGRVAGEILNAAEVLRAEWPGIEFLGPHEHAIWHGDGQRYRIERTVAGESIYDLGIVPGWEENGGDLLRGDVGITATLTVTPEGQRLMQERMELARRAANEIAATMAPAVTAMIETTRGIVGVFSNALIPVGESLGRWANSLPEAERAALLGHHDALRESPGGES